MKNPTETSQIEMTERQLATLVEEYMRDRDWKFYHVYEQEHYAKRSESGFWDYMAFRERQIIFELKTEKGKLSEGFYLTITKKNRKGKLQYIMGQEDWGNLYEIAKQEHYLWRPSDWESGLIQKILD